MTKKFFIVAVILLCFTKYIYGQNESRNFKIEDENLIWQMVYESDSSANIINQFIRLGIIDNILTKEDQIIGDLKPFDTDYKGAGFTEMGTPMYIVRSRIIGHIIVDIKKGKYRVTIKDIRLIQKYDDPLTKQGQETSLKDFALRGTNDFKPAFLKSPSIILDYTFKKRIKPTKTNDNW
jgi:hypothetical protein